MATDLNLQVAGIKDDYKYGFRDSDDHYAFKSGKGLTRAVVNQISEMKNEPAWMREFRLKALEAFHQKPTPTWGGELSELNFDDIHYYMKAADRQGKSWDDVPAEIKNTFDKLASPRPSASSWPASVPSTSRKSSITACARTFRRRVSSSSIPTRRCVSIPTWS